MRSIIAALLVGITLLMQLFLFQSWQLDGTIPNVTLGLLVMLCLYMNVEQMLWIGLLSGLAFDIYAKADFGFYLGFYILLVLVCKLVLKFDEIERSWWRASLVVAGAAAVQYVLVGIALIGDQPGWWFAGKGLSYVVLTTAVGMVWYLVLTQIRQTVKDKVLKTKG